MATIDQKRAAACEALGVTKERFPRSVAIIMDGNGRWARSQNLPRVAGHRRGAEVARNIVTEASNIGLEALTLYAFSIENWSRPQNEVNALMGLYAEYLARDRQTLVDNNIRLVHLGRRSGLPQSVLDELDESMNVSASNTGTKLCLAINYSGRCEITDAVRDIATRAAEGEINPRHIDESLIADALYTRDLPDPDLLIRTSGERRLSNFLLWQISYAELYVTDVYWPDFDEKELHNAIREYASRHRRFGNLNNTNT